MGLMEVSSFSFLVLDGIAEFVDTFHLSSEDFHQSSENVMDDDRHM